MYTKPLWADRSESIYRAKDADAMRYVSEEAVAQMKAATGLGDADAEADAADAQYQSQSKRGGPLQVSEGVGGEA